MCQWLAGAQVSAQCLMNSIVHFRGLQSSVMPEVSVLNVIGQGLEMRDRNPIAFNRK